jgi:hypothetical protein
MQTNPLFVEEDERIDAIYRVIKGRITWENLVPSCIEAAREIEALPKLKGPEKLALLQKVLKYALRETKHDPVEKERILFFIDTVVPVLMQAAIMASKSPIVAQVQAVCVGCWTKKS